MQTRLCTLGLSLLLCLPAVAETPKPAPAPPAAAYHWQVIKLNHIAPAAALVALHWNTATPSFPDGVERVYGIQSSHSLLLHATTGSFVESKRLVQTVDK